MLNDAERERMEEIKSMISQQCALSAKGSYEEANKKYYQYTRLIDAYLHDDKGFSLAEKLMESDMPEHRYVGAYYLLPIKPQKALFVLRKLFGIKRHFVGMNARTLYDEWKLGRLKFPVIDTADQTIHYVDKTEYIRHINP